MVLEIMAIQWAVDAIRIRNYPMVLAAIVLLVVDILSDVVGIPT